MRKDTRFSKALRRENNGAPPIWMMRQAGRYHAHYQELRRAHGFVELCKNPDLAAEVAMGPIRDFDFDAAILFSDILFPIEAMGPSLVFDPGPQFSYYLKSVDDLAKYNPPPSVDGLSFQALALQKTRKMLPMEKDLIGFVGGPLTLYMFAVHGSHKTDLTDGRAGLRDGRFAGFMEKLLPLLLANMVLQAQAGCDALAVFESCAGDIDVDDYRHIYLPYLSKLLQDFKNMCPNTPLIYYGKNVGTAHFDMVAHLPVTVLGVDYNQNMSDVFTRYGERFSIQGNFDPAHLTLPAEDFHKHLEIFLEDMMRVPQHLRAGWICGLGHGVTPHARQENVRDFVQIVRRVCA